MPATATIAILVGLALGAAPAGAATNRIFTVAGTGSFGFSGDGGPATAAQITSPTAVAVTADGGYLIVDQGNAAIRRVGPDGTLTTVAGSGVSGFTGDGGPATSAQLNLPNGVAEMPDGGFLIADSGNARVRRVSPAGIITTVAGSSQGFSGDGGPATSAQLNFPIGLAVRPDGSYLIGDNDNNRVRSVSAAGTISTVAGNGSRSSAGDGGPATSAAIDNPAGVALTADGGFLVASQEGARVRRVASDGTITTVAGTGSAGFSGDGGPATAAQLNFPSAVASTADGGYLVADPRNHRVRIVSPTGTIATVAGTGVSGYNGDDIPATTAQLNNPLSVAVNAQGDFLITDSGGHRIRGVDAGDPPPPPPPAPAGPGPPVSVELDVTAVERKPGDPNTVTATVKRQDGSIAAGVEVRYTITGVNPGSGVLATGATGTVAIGWDGVQEGTDTLTVWLDLNGNAVQDASEPADTATVGWVLPAPRVARSVNVGPISGVVLVKLPAGAASRSRDAWVQAAQSRFIPLDQARNVPVGTIVDTRRGVVQLTSALNARGATQTAQFFKGNFQIRQSRAARPVTELRMNETLTCRTSRRSRVGASRARTRQLWGRGSGRFRTRGRNSTATVRGTLWLTKDTCTTTTTVVREGTVIVRDLAKRKNIRVRAGERYVARARGR